MKESSKLLFDILNKELFKKEKGEYNKDYFLNNIEKAYSISKNHDIANVFAYCLENTHIPLNEKLKEDLKNEKVKAVYRYEQLNYELKKICEIFEKEGVDYILLKGDIIRRYYDKPWLRTSCDIDILLKGNYKKTIKMLLEKYNYKYLIKTQHDISLESQSGVHIELHFLLMFYNLLSDNFNKMVWETATLSPNSKHCYNMDNSLFYIYHISHMAQHMLLRGGSGIKPFIDLYYIKSKIELDSERISKLLKEYKLSKFEKNVIDLFNVWFSSEKPTKTTESLETYVLTGGVYGSLKNATIVGKTKSKGKFKYLIKRIFLPYRELSNLYPILKKVVILYPFFQVVRWFRLLLPKGVGIKTAIKEAKLIYGDIELSKQREIEELFEELDI